MARLPTAGYAQISPHEETTTMVETPPDNKAATIEWVYKGLVIALLGLATFIGQDVWQGQKKIAENFDQRIRQMELSAAETSGNRFSSKDWTQAKLILDGQAAEREKRIYQLEITTKQIEKSLDRIEAKLGTK